MARSSLDSAAALGMRSGSRSVSASRSRSVAPSSSELERMGGGARPLTTRVTPARSVAAGLSNIEIITDSAEDPDEVIVSRGLVDADAPQYSFSKRAVLASVVLVALVVVGAVVFASHGPCRNSDGHSAPSADRLACEGAACGRRAAVATTSDYATRIGLQVLRDGGNAVDAAVAVQFALNVAQPQSTGIGGGCFVVYYDAKTSTVHALDGREEAPAASTPNMFCADDSCAADPNCTACPGGVPLGFDERVTGGHPVGVPGTFAAVVRLLGDFGSGKKTLAQLAAPAAKLARDGVVMYADLHDKIVANRDRLLRFNASAALFLPGRGGTPVPVGQLWRNPDLAATLEELGRRGRDGFYSASGLAAEVVSAARNATNPVTGRASRMVLDDVLRYRAVYREPTRVLYRGRLVWGMPPPSSGGLTLGMALNMLESFQLGDLRPASVEMLHRLVDAQDAAFADRNVFMADADWVDVDREAMLDKAYAASRVNTLMKAARAAGAPLPADCPGCAGAASFASAPETQRHGTTHLVVADAEGNVVSMTTTIEENMGSAVVVPGRGFLLNNELTDFAATATDPVSGAPYANRPEGGTRPRRTALGADDAASLGGKRPMSSMTPTVVMEDERPAGRPELAMGSPGGSRIIGTVLNALVGVLDSGLTLRQATDLPRAVSRNDFVFAEAPLLQGNNSVGQQLRDRGFNVELYDTPRPAGYVQSLRRREGGGWIATADTSRLPSALALAY